MTDATVTVAWYASREFVVEFAPRFEPGFPPCMGLARGEVRVHLSEHTGDTRPGTLA